MSQSKKRWGWLQLGLLGVTLWIVTAGLLKTVWAEYSGSRLEVLREVPSAHRISGLVMDPSYGRLPLQFEANRGQVDSQVKFLFRGSTYAMFFTPAEVALSLRKAHPEISSEERRASPKGTMPRKVERNHVRIRLVGASADTKVVGLEELRGKINYFRGKDPKDWQTNIATYARVKYEGIYPGIDLTFYVNEGQLEYDFFISPGAKPETIKLFVEGADRLQIDNGGDVLLYTEAGDLHLRKPLVYQDMDGAKQVIPGRYLLEGTNHIGFQVAAYDATRPLVIDPVLVYSTYLGGSAYDQGSAIAADASGCAYMAGTTQSPDFPATPGAYDTACGTDGYCNSLGVYVYDAFVVKFSADGSELIYSTFLGGSENESVGGIAVDSSGNAYILGTTESSDFPTTPGAFQNSCNAPAGYACRAAFVTNLSPDGSELVYSTYLTSGFDAERGSSANDSGNAIAVDGEGNAYVTGSTGSGHFPVTEGAFQKSFGGASDAFVTKLNVAGSGLVYSTYLGGSGLEDDTRIAIDSLGNAYVTGSTLNFPGTLRDFPTTPGAFQPTGPSLNVSFVAKLNADGSDLVYSTYIGGNYVDHCLGIAVDREGHAYVTGQTKSTDFPLKSPIQGPNDWTGTTGDAFVTKFTPDGSGLVYSTYLGGKYFDYGQGIAVDTYGNAYVTGSTNSPDFPTAKAWQPLPGGNDDAFVAKLSPDGSQLIYSTFLGGSTNDEGRAIALDPMGSTYVTGFATSRDFPTASPWQPIHWGGDPHFDAFLAKFSETTIAADLDVKTDGVWNSSTDQITYTIIITNNGPDDAGKVTIDNLLPSGATFVSGSTSQGSCYGLEGRIACELGALAKGKNIRVILVIIPAPVVPFVNTARVNSANTDDPDRSNNTSQLDLKDVKIHFTVSVNKNGTGKGTVASDPPGISCGLICSASFDIGSASNTFVTLRAEPEPGSIFVGWSGGGCGSTGDCVLTSHLDTEITATFNIAGPPSIETSFLPDGEVGIAYDGSLEIRGGMPPYAIRIMQGVLPSGLKLDAAGNITGIPTKAGNSNIIVQVVDHLGFSVGKSFKFKIFKALTLSAKRLKKGTIGKKYNVTLKAAGGKNPYTFSLFSGSLPSGLSLDSLTGKIAGIPMVAGDYPLTFQVVDLLTGANRKGFILVIK